MEIEKVEVSREDSLVRDEDNMSVQPLPTAAVSSSLSSCNVLRNECSTLPHLCLEDMDVHGFTQDSEDAFRCGDSVVEHVGVDQRDSKEDQDAADDNAQRAVWEVIQPSEYNLNKLDGWSLKVNGSPKFDSPDPDAESLPISDIEAWLKENLSERIYNNHIESLDQKTGRRKSKVRWADVESRLQNLDLMLDSSMEASFSAGTLSS